MRARGIAWVLLLCGLRGGSPRLAGANSTETWLAKRAALIHDVYGEGPGVLPTRSVPDAVLTYESTPGVTGLVWNLSTLFPITSTVFYAPASGDASKKSRTAFFFHHGHTNCICPTKAGDPPVAAAKCRPGCKSVMPSHPWAGSPETKDPG